MLVKREVDLVQLISSLVEQLSQTEKENLFAQIIGETKKGVPLSIFTTKLSGLGALVLFLKDTKTHSISEIATILNRNTSTIYSTYQKAKKQSISIDYKTISIPLSVFANRKFSILESLVSYLKQKHNLKLVQISTLLNKKYSTVRTTFVRYKEKCQE